MTDSSLISSWYGQFVLEKLNSGWTAYILTFMFAHINGSLTTVCRKTEKELERIYATMLTRIVRNPMSESMVGRLPIWIGCPDFPVPKHAKQSIHVVTVNEGLHFHAICLIPPESRLKEALSEHIAAHQGLYVRDGKLVNRFRADLIQSSPGYVVDYVFKSTKRRRTNPDQIIVLPRSRSELGDRIGA